jgi:membrane-bound lytic murein transglycosylase D
MDVRTLASLNGLPPGAKLRAGQKLRLAAAGPAKTGAGTTPAANASGRRVTYTVRRGDTLYSIAKVLQVSIDALRGWNSLGTTPVLRPGQKLVAFVAPRS